MNFKRTYLAILAIIGLSCGRQELWPTEADRLRLPDEPLSAVTDGGTLGQPCVAQCDGTSNCDPSQYCPDSCLACPCADICRLKP